MFSYQPDFILSYYQSVTNLPKIYEVIYLSESPPALNDLVCLLPLSEKGFTSIFFV